MRVVLRLPALALILCLALSSCWAADIPQPRLAMSNLPEAHVQFYFWKPSPVAGTAQLLTLFCRSCQTSNGETADVPLVAVLRDTLGDDNPDNDRVASIWLLTYSRPNVGRKLLSAVPFFFWRAGGGSTEASSRDVKPFFDLTQPQHPVMSELGRDLLQWAAFDPLGMPVRATSRAYRTNAVDYERLHLEEAVSYLRDAPVSDDSAMLTRTQLNTLIARLELRKRLLGGLVPARRAEKVGEESRYEEERIRSRNWEMLRQCAEKTGLLFEPISLAGARGQYAILWMPVDESFHPAGTSLGPVWKLLNIHNPWTDDRLKDSNTPVYTRVLDDNGSFVPVGEPGARAVRVTPLAAYGLDYPKLPLLLVDFRDKLHVRWHEMTQRSINEITAGIIGISHFTNWYYYVAADLYDFVISRHGGAMNQAARLDSYARFRSQLALDRDLDPELRRDMQRRVDYLAINPLEAAPAREMEAARARYAQLLDKSQENGALVERLQKQRRAELAAFGETRHSSILQNLLHASTLGLYTHRVKQDPENLAELDRDRRLEYHLAFLDSLASADTQPEVAYDSSRIRASVDVLNNLMPAVTSASVRLHAEAVLLRLKSLSQDADLQSDCSFVLANLRRSEPALRGVEVSGVLTSPRRPTTFSGGLEARK